MQRRRQQATSFDVARIAGVSQAAVSRAFTPGGRIAEATRAKVLKAALALKYVPNTIARSLSTRRSNMVAIVIGDMENPFYATVLALFSRRLQEMGKHVLLFTVPQGGSVDDAIGSVLGYQIDGLVVTAATISSRMARLCVQQSIPVVLYNRHVPGLGVNSVCCDNVAGGRLVAQTLHDAGARSFAVICGDASTSTTRDRIRGFTSELANLSVRAKAIMEEGGRYTYDGGFAAALRLLGGRNRPDALFCLNDIMALGALDAIRGSLKLKVPDDVMLAGFDDIPDAGRAAYRLTTVRQPVDEMVEETLALLGLQGSPPASKPLVRRFPGVLVMRDTV